MGSYTKIVMTFDEIWWPVEMASFVGIVNDYHTRSTNSTGSSYGTTCRGQKTCLGAYVALHNFWANDGVPVLEIIAIGDASKRIGKSADALVRAETFRLMENTIGDGILEVNQLDQICKEFKITRWDSDPVSWYNNSCFMSYCMNKFTLNDLVFQYSQGAYSHWPLNASHWHIEELASPDWDDTLHFAGEATIPEYEGSVHAAIISGKKVAQDVIQKIKINENRSSSL